MSPLRLTQFAVLGGMDWRVRGTLINIADWKDTPSDEGRHLLITEAGMNINPFNLICVLHQQVFCYESEIDEIE